jgi:hypothetical protein
MDPQDVRVRISGDDQTAAAFSAAQQRVQQFQAQTSTAGTAMAGSMGSAREATRLFSEEVLRMPRALQGVVASSALLAPAMQLAFAPLAIYGFVQILSQVPAVIQKCTDYLAGYTAASKEAMASVVKSNEQIYASFTKIATGYQFLEGLHRAQAQNTAPASVSEGAGMAARLRLGAGDPLGAIAAYSLTQWTNLGKINAATTEGVHLSELEEIVQKRLTTLFGERNKEADAALEKAKKHTEELQKQLVAIMATVNAMSITGGVGPWKSQTRAQTIQGLAPLNQAEGPMASTMGIDPQIAADALQRMQDMRGWFESTRLPAELLKIEVAKLDELFGSNHGEVYQRALAQIKDRFGESNLAAQKFGQAIGDAMKQGALMGRDWGDVLKSLLVTITELIVKFTILKKLEDQYGKGGASGGWGGFATALIGGFAGGHASGGFVGPGMSYLVGERGPELLTMGAAGGYVSPNSALGGQTIYQDFRGAVVTDDLLRKADGVAMMSITETRAVQRAVGTVRERSLRGAR